jgi:hypothetical protein
MLNLWMGSISAPLVYLIFLKDNDDSSAFIVGHIVLGIFGLLRENYLKNKFEEKS